MLNKTNWSIDVVVLVFLERSFSLIRNIVNSSMLKLKLALFLEKTKELHIDINIVNSYNINDI